MKATEMIGRPVMNARGRTAGQIECLLFDPDKMKLAAIVWVRPGLVRIRRRASVTEGTVDMEGARLTRKGPKPKEVVELLDARAVSEEGDTQGWITDVEIDLKTNEIEAVELGQRGLTGWALGRRVVSRRGIVSIGPEKVVLRRQAVERAPAVGGLEERVECAARRVARATAAAAGALEEREADWVLGKTAGRDVYDKDGSIIVGKGEKVTARHVSRARQAGRLTELALASGFQVLRETWDGLTDELKSKDSGNTEK